MIAQPAPISAGNQLDSGIQLTVVIVTYRSKCELPACLDGLLASQVRSRIVLVDNASGDGTLELAREYAASYENVVAISSEVNIGLAAANNLAIPYLVGQYVLILNPDTALEAGAISTLIRTFEQDIKVGVAGPLCMYEDGSPHTSYHKGWGYSHLLLWRLLPYSLIRGLYDRHAKYDEGYVHFVSGACMMVRRGRFEKIGGYDSLFFLTVEDACDVCDRVRDLGYRIKFVPAARVMHLCGRSGESVPFLTTLEGYKGSIYYFTKRRGKLGGY